LICQAPGHDRLVLSDGVEDGAAGYLIDGAIGALRKRLRRPRNGFQIGGLQYRSALERLGGDNEGLGGGRFAAQLAHEESVENAGGHNRDDQPDSKRLKQIVFLHDSLWRPAGTTALL